MSGAGDDLNSFAEKAETEADLRRALQNALRALSKAKASRQELVEAVHQAAKDAALAYPHPQLIKRPSSGKPGDLWALTHLTDWQRGKTTRSYNSEICDQRVSHVVERVLRITDLQRHASKISSAALLLGGDMLEGTTIFPAQSWEVDASLFDQLFGCAALIERVVRTLLNDFDHLEVWEEYGNHGRIGKYGEQPAQDNMDRIAYKIARDRVGEHKRLSWHASDNFYNHGKIGNYSFLLVHGDEIKSFGGNTPAFGIIRKVNAWATGVVEPFIDCYMGHYHTPQKLALANGGAVYITGSTESDNTYAKEFCAATGQPSQRLHFIDPEKGRVVSEHQIWID